MWFFYAVLSSVFAALTAVFAKIGLNGINSNLATAIRTVIVLIMAWILVFLTGAQTGLSQVSRRGWLFLILSGIATGASWLFYFHALQAGEASRVVAADKLSVVFTVILAFLFLHEQMSVKVIAGVLLITAGTLVMVL